MPTTACAEFEEDDGLTDVDELRKALPLFTVLDRNVPWDSRLHSVAIDNYLFFAKTSDLILGLGSFDPPKMKRNGRYLGKQQITIQCTRVAGRAFPDGKSPGRNRVIGTVRHT